MIIEEYNCEGYVKDQVAWNLIEFIINDIETANHREVPKQNVLVRRLREAGWDEKVRIGNHCNHAIDGILENVGVCVYFGHSAAAFQKFLSLQSIYLDRRIRECYYITQTADTAELRHRLVNPDARPGTNGNRVTFDNITAAMGYYHRFITLPMTIIGVDIEAESIQP